MHSRIFVSRTLLCSSALFVFGLLVLAPDAPIRAEEHADHAMHDGMAMPMGDTVDPQVQAKFLTDKRESEFNHHLAGLFVLVAGLIILAQDSLS